MNSATAQFIGELQTDPNVLGIILFGSWARGNNRADSDVDLLVIVREGFRRIVEYRDGQAFEITYTTEQGVAAYWNSNPNDAIELWNVAKILFDRDGTVKRLRQAGNEIRAKGKPSLRVDQYEHFKFDVHDQLKAIKEFAKSDPTTARMLLSAKVLQLTELFFDIRQLWIPPPKQRLAVINNMNHDLHDLFARYYYEHSLREQINIVHSIVPMVFDK
ncbi:MAG TPA: nucleotidyltransferase domain-containing protein [Anaerolineales bacterium]|nr:nucleotidyltransferase domain-containing protein [Anaerolineales bacterium]